MHHPYYDKDMPFRFKTNSPPTARLFSITPISPGQFFSVLLCAALSVSAAKPAKPLPTFGEDWTLSASPPGHAPGLDSSLLSELKAYNDIRSAGIAGWDTATGGMHIVTRFADHSQLHRVKTPGGSRTQLTFFPKRVAAMYLNPTGARDFLYLQDTDGNEQFRLFYSQPETGHSQSLGPDSGRVASVLWSKNGARFVYTYSAPRSDKWEIRLGDTSGSDRPLILREGAWFPVDWSQDEKHLLLIKYLSATHSELHHFSFADSSLTRLLPDREESISGAFWLEDETRNPPVTPKTLLFLSDREGEFHKLYRHQNGKVTTLSPPSPWDVEWAVPDRRGRFLIYSLNEQGYSRLHRLDLRTGRASALKGLPSGLIGKPLFPHPGKEIPGNSFAFTLNTSTHPGDVYGYSLASGKLTRWTESETGGIPSAHFVAPELITYPTVDSLNGAPRQLSAWLYRPPNTPRAPVVLSLHGGPELQARPGFDAFTQYLAGRKGIAVLKPNVRGSTGYGKSFTRLDDGVLREGAVHDVGALLAWVGRDGRLDSSRIGVMGRSYGGYLALATMVHYGNRIQAGINTVGIANFVSFLKNTSEYRRDLRRVEYGDERDPKMFQFLHGISPLTHADKLNTPLLLSHGRQDPRVPYSESVALFETLRKKKVPVWFLTFLREGHAFREPENRLIHDAVQTQFLLEHLMKGP